MKKPSTGYEKRKKPKKNKNHYIGNLLVANPKKVSFNEKLVKFLIYLALRLVIAPKKWKDPKKNYEIIDRFQILRFVLIGLLQVAITTPYCQLD